MKILKITLITLAVLALAGWFLLFRSVPLKVSAETTILTEPRTEDGRWVDYRAYLIAQFPKDGNTEKNSARGMVELFGLEADDEENLKSEHWEMLGLEPPDENQKAPFSIPEILIELICGDGSPEIALPDLETIREYVTAATPALDAMAEVIQKAEFYAFPVVPNSSDEIVEALLPDLSFLNRIATAFELRAYLRKEDGDLEGEQADRLILMKFGRQIQNQALTLITLLRGNAIEKRGAGLKDPEKWKTLEPIDRQENLRRVLEFERLLAPSAIQNVCRKGKKGSSYGNLVPDDAPNGFSEWLVTHLGFDWNVVAKRLNENQQKILFQEENAPPFEVPAHDSWMEFPKIFSRRARSEVLADFLAIPSCHMMPHVRQFLLEDVPAPTP
ncbi:MAG: hypothetical protein K6C40_03500 [Thermoguttaceae bacterium]|nr:hypothetical protein [Thermoguttaceae bacterium]